LAQLVQVGLRYAAMSAHAVAAQPAGRRQLKRAGEPAVVGEQQEALGIEIEPSDADHAASVWATRRRWWAALRIGTGGDEPARL
jgi:hypothetical protein